MSYIEHSIAEPGDPFDYHLYVGFARADRDLVRNMKQLTKSGLKSYFRFSLNEPPTQFDISLPDRVKDGISSSEKCLLFVTQAYVEDELCDIEIMEILNKAEIFEDAIIILLIGIDREKVPVELQPHMHKLITFELPYNFAELNALTGEFCRELFDKRPRLLSNLPQTPEKISGSYEALIFFDTFLVDVLSGFGERMLRSMYKTTKSDKASSQLQYVSKLLVVVTDSCCPPKEMDIPNVYTNVGSVATNVNRFGEKHRDFKVSLMKLIDGVQEYFFAVEFPCCLLTLHKIQESGLTGMTKQQLFDERRLFCESLRDRIDSRQLQDQCRLIEWHDERCGLVDCLLSVCRNESQSFQICENAQLTNKSSMSQVESVEKSLFQLFPLTRRPRGICAIIDMKKSMDEVEHHETESTADRLEKLFGERLFFDIRVKKSGVVTKAELEKLIQDLSNLNHQNFDAFVCCFISHGRRGVIRTSDQTHVYLLDLAQYFDDRQCPHLRNKPKMFFSLTCQSEDESNSALYQSLVQDLRIAGRDDETLQANVSEQVALERSDELLRSDSTQCSAVSVDEGERLIPSSPDFIISYCTLTERTASLYVDSLVENLQVNVHLERALKDVENQVKLKVSELNISLPIMEAIPVHFSTASGGKAVIFTHD